jgi:hypothetical protein
MFSKKKNAVPLNNGKLFIKRNGLLAREHVTEMEMLI